MKHLLLSVWLCAVGGLSEAATPPNIVFFFTDDQGYGDISAHGNPILKTPHLDRLRAESLRFEDFHVSTDSAKTWTEPVKLNQPNHTTRSNGIRLSTGELLVPLHLRGTKAGGVLKSSDGGQTWKRFGAVANPEGQGGEPTIAETKARPGARPRRRASPPHQAPATCFAPAMARSSSPIILARRHCASL